jgi:hypothetical protein
MVKLTKNIKRSLVTIIAVTMAILLIAAPVRAQSASLNLPPSTVNVIAQNDNTSYFVMTLSSVPSGYDVTNATYSGWCIDYSVDMTRNETFEAQLYSSLNPPAGNFSSVQWDMVNYILNSALASATGNYTETQDAIWYFVNNTASYTHTLDSNESLIVQDALANGTGFVPAPGQSVAVIVFPLYAQVGSETFQDTILQVTMPQPLSVNATVTGDATLIANNTYQMNQGATAYFSANAVGGIQPYSYTWYVNGTSSSTNQTMTFTAPQTGTYIIYVNATDSSSPPQNATSTNYTVNVVPEYPLFAIVLLVALTAPLVIIIRRKKNKA